MLAYVDVSQSRPRLLRAAVQPSQGDGARSAKLQLDLHALHRQTRRLRKEYTHSADILRKWGEEVVRQGGGKAMHQSPTLVFKFKLLPANVSIESC